MHSVGHQMSLDVLLTDFCNILFHFQPRFKKKKTQHRINKNQMQQAEKCQPRVLMQKSNAGSS